MAPGSDQVYFPSLGECLTGEQTVISWQLAATALSDPTGRRQISPAIVEFLRDDFVFQLLKDSSRVFSPDNDATAKDFETKTAPINATPTDDRYDLKAIKEDAQWLSKNAKINLVAALRVVVLEQQNRPSSHLAGPLSSQDATNLQEAAGLENGQGSSLISELGAGAALDAEDIWSNFEKADSRRCRLFDTYLIERRSFMMVAEYALTISLYKRLPIFVTLEDDLSELYGLKLKDPAKPDLKALLNSYLQAATARVNLIEAGLGAQTDDPLLATEMIELEWFRTLLAEIVHTCSVVYLVVDCLGDDAAPSSAVNQWFALMDRISFFDRLQAVNDGIGELLMPLKTLCATISLSLLKPERTMTYLVERTEDPTQPDDTTDSYATSPETLEQVHKSLMNAANSDSETASPVIFAWSVLLHQLNRSYQSRSEKRDNLLQQNYREQFENSAAPRPTTMARRNSAGSIFSIESSKFDGFLENQLVPKDSHVVEQLAATVTDQGKVYDIISHMSRHCGSGQQSSLTPLVGSRARSAFIELLKVTYQFVGYQSDPCTSLLAVLSAERDYWDISPVENLSPSQDLLANMLQDEYAMHFYFENASARYPDEFLPFITMCRILVSSTSVVGDEMSDMVLNYLRKTPTLTLNLPDAFVDYRLVHEDENTNTFTILQDIPLIALSSSWKRRYIEDEGYRIPANTAGKFLTDNGRIAMLDYPHSTLALLGRRLEINLAKEGYRTELGYLEPDEVAEVISLLSTLIRVDTIKASKSNNTNAVMASEDDILQECSQHISGGKDIITVVCDTMDYFMQDELAMSDDVSVNVLNKCIQFLDAVLPLQPSRIWSYIARSELLNSDSRAGKLTKITGNIDLMAERFDFLESSMRFFTALIETAQTSAVQRHGGNSLASRQNVENPWAGTADKVLAKVSLSIAQSAVDIFENTSTWKFETVSKRASLMQSVTPLLDNIVLYAYSMGDPHGDDSLTLCLKPAAAYIIDCFLSPSTGTLRFQPILTTLLSAFTTPDTTFYPSRTQMARSQTISVLSLSATLLRAAELLEKPSKMFETYLFKLSTLLARLCGVSDHYRTPALWLLDSLVSNGGRSSNDPPSLLGYLGPQISKSFLQVLANLNKPFVLPKSVQCTWGFFSSVLRNRQQWMSNCLLTGQTPREAMRDATKKEMSSQSVFASALTRLKNLKELELPEAVVVLDFVASAQNYWPWTVFTLQKDTTYLRGMRDYVRQLKPSNVTVKISVTKASFQARIAAYIAEIFAMQLYHSRHLGKSDELAGELAQDLDYFLREGVEVEGYNKSLHANFSKNFASRYAGCKVESFKRTSLEPRELGDNFYYDLVRADEMLRFDPGWLGRNNKGFKTEMELANTNLSLVDAQIALFHGWEFLLLELSTCLPGNENLARHRLQVAQQCLNANQSLPGPESIFLKLVDARADLALVLVQRLAKSKIPRTSDIDQLLATLVGAIDGVNDPYSPASVAYYRTLLKSLYVTLRAYRFGEGSGNAETEMDQPAVSVVQTVLNILDKVVARGFRLLVSYIHEKDVDVSPEDLALLTAVLQACLALPSIDQSQIQILNILASHEAVHAATSLFSWADKLALHGDPVYGELSVLFLLELSALPQVAEQLACDGILSSLLSANLMKFMLKANLSPHAESPTAQRCYSIWAKGLLPLMLNLLISLGATVAPEVAYVLNQAPHLLQTSVDRFEAPGASRTRSPTNSYITLLATSEVHSLALLTRILSALRVNNNRDIPQVDWDSAGMLENVDFWLSGKKLLKERLMPLGPREVEWRSTKAGPKDEEKFDNLLEEKVAVQLEAVRTVLSEEPDGE